MKRPHAICISDTDDLDDTDGEESEEVRSTSRAKAGAATYLTRFKDTWSKEWLLIRKETTLYHYWCYICRAERNYGQQGRRDVETHVMSAGHLENVKAIKTSQTIPQFFHMAPTVDSMTQLESKTRRAEVKVATTLVKHIFHWPSQSTSVLYFGKSYLTLKLQKHLAQEKQRLLAL